jgi:hypothetical protein
MSIATLEELQRELETKAGIGFLLPVPEHVYRIHDALSQSELKLLAGKSPKHLWHYKKRPRPQSDAQKLGTAAHIAILQPLQFETSYLKAKKSDRRTVKGRAEFAEAKEQAEKLGKIVLDSQEYSIALEMRDAIRSDQGLSSLLTGGVAERACFGYLHGVHAKVLLDFYKPAAHEIIDLKSTKSAERFCFEKDIRKYRYHWQACWYSDLVKEITGESPSFKILAVESHPPYCAAIYEIGFDLIAIARKEIMESIEVLRRCRETDIWPGYSSDVQMITAHGWEWEKFKNSLDEGKAS